MTAVLGDFHTHSTLDDGGSTLEEMAQAACARGLTRLGFSGHSWCQWEEDFCLPRDQVPVYLETARALKERYRGKLDLFVGMELDCYGQRPEGLDYGIGSVHGLLLDGRFYPVDESPEKSRRAVEEQFGGDWYRYTDAYYDLVADLPQKTGCDWIGHFDLVTKFNQRLAAFDETAPRYLRRAMEVMEHLVKQSVAFELNTGAISRGYRTQPYPAMPLLRHLRRLGGELILSSDAHQAGHLCYGFDKGVEAAAQAGFDHVNVWTSAGFQAIRLSV